MTKRKPGIWVVEISRDGGPWEPIDFMMDRKAALGLAKSFAEDGNEDERYRAARYERVSK